MKPVRAETGAGADQVSPRDEIGELILRDLSWRERRYRGRMSGAGERVARNPLG